MVSATMKLGALGMLSLAASTANASCPFLDGGHTTENKVVESRFGRDRLLSVPVSDYKGEPDFSPDFIAAVRADVEALFTVSQDFWPADFGNYAPLFVRLAWHCAGSYRNTDGRGGCDGGRIQFFPEFAWPDQTNLDKALTILEPIVLKYGDAISLADLIILTGDVAIESMGGPSVGVCLGRTDDANGFESLELGPTPEQEAVAPCPVEGACEAPIGTTTVGLIYVNPGGPQGVTDPEGSALEIRDVFGRMGMNDTETVALVGGGHAFGKVHGACPTGPGPNPMEQPEDPWPGTCGEPGSPTFGRAENTFTSGFEGAWTVNPTAWDNQYFIDLLQFDWVTTENPAGNTQWMPQRFANDTRTEPLPNIIMLTADIAFIRDPIYLPIVQKFADSQEAIDIAFSEAWYKLNTRDLGPVTRCEGFDFPSAREFQLPLPEAPEEVPSVTGPARQIKQMILDDPDTAAKFVTLAFNCASIFRATDYSGGCNGARIRSPPQSEFPINQGLDAVLELLEPVSVAFPDVSFADLIVLAGTIGVKAGGPVPNLSFCPGRVDAALDDPNNELLSILDPEIQEYSTVILEVRDRQRITGYTVPQLVALTARPRSAALQIARGFSGSYTNGDSAPLSNDFFRLLIETTWMQVEGSDGREYVSMDDPDVFVLATDLALIWDPELNAVTKRFAAEPEAFFKEFGSAWTTVMNADRFASFDTNECDPDFDSEDSPDSGDVMDSEDIIDDDMSLGFRFFL